MEFKIKKKHGNNYYDYFILYFIYTENKGVYDELKYTCTFNLF